MNRGHLAGHSSALSLHGYFWPNRHFYKNLQEGIANQQPASAPLMPTLGSTYLHALRSKRLPAGGLTEGLHAVLALSITEPVNKLRTYVVGAAAGSTEDNVIGH